MNQQETLPAPALDANVAPRSKWEREYRAFLQLLPQLLTSHRGQYVAVHEGKVVDSGEDEIALALRVYGKYDYVPMHIGRVVEQPPPAERIPRYRILHGETA
jgi:hypothetical protein